MIISLSLLPTFKLQRPALSKYLRYSMIYCILEKLIPVLSSVVVIIGFLREHICTSISLFVANIKSLLPQIFPNVWSKGNIETKSSALPAAKVIKFGVNKGKKERKPKSKTNQKSPLQRPP